MTPLGLLNFIVLQWFGVRLARVVEVRKYENDESFGFGLNARRQRVTVGWTVLRWIWPLTGWWNDFRWIARRFGSRR